MIKFGPRNLRIPRFEKPVYVVAGGLTDYRKRYPEKNTCQLCTEAFRMAIKENDLKVSPEEFRRSVNWCVCSQFADHFGDQLLAAAKVHDCLGFDPLGNIEVKTGGSSVLAAAQAVASGYANCVPVVGWGTFFRGLREKKLLATRCTNPECAEKRLWLPPRCECPDCWHAMEWAEAPQAGTIHTHSTVLYPGAPFRASYPCPLISVEIEGVCTKLMGYLKEGAPEIAMPVKAVFNTQNPTNTILDLAWVPA